jgi:hypothetical protein
VIYADLARFPLICRHFGTIHSEKHGRSASRAQHWSNLGDQCPAHFDSAWLIRRIRWEGDGGEGWIRTSVRLRGQIYSLLPLTTRPPLQVQARRAMWRRAKAVSTRGSALSCRRFAALERVKGIEPSS